jgi:hypothetical protein
MPEGWEAVTGSWKARMPEGWEAGTIEVKKLRRAEVERGGIRNGGCGTRMAQRV